MAGDGEINEMRKIKEMSGNNAMLRRERGGRPIVDTPPLRMVPARESRQKRGTHYSDKYIFLFRQIHFSYSDKYIFLFRQRHFPIQTNTFSHSDKYNFPFRQIPFLFRKIHFPTQTNTNTNTL